VAGARHWLRATSPRCTTPHSRCTQSRLARLRAQSLESVRFRRSLAVCPRCLSRALVAIIVCCICYAAIPAWAITRTAASVLCAHAAALRHAAGVCDLNTIRLSDRAAASVSRSTVASSRATALRIARDSAVLSVLANTPAGNTRAQSNCGCFQDAPPRPYHGHYAGCISNVAELTVAADTCRRDSRRSPHNGSPTHCGTIRRPRTAVGRPLATASLQRLAAAQSVGPIALPAATA